MTIFCYRNIYKGDSLTYIMVKQIKLILEDKEFKQLQRAKRILEKFYGIRVTWKKLFLEATK